MFSSTTTEPLPPPPPALFLASKTISSADDVSNNFYASLPHPPAFIPSAPAFNEMRQISISKQIPDQPAPRIPEAQPSAPALHLNSDLPSSSHMSLTGSITSPPSYSAAVETRHVAPVQAVPGPRALQVRERLRLARENVPERHNGCLREMAGSYHGVGMVAILQFHPTDKVDLLLTHGTPVHCHATYEDGWGFGTNMITGHSGFFPMQAVVESSDVVMDD
ncbi:hypothetical protein HK097_003399 [Rhizophlyctis rosea]|uniref:SH3 domain-containing protein n=1 Tax=Rhizophlyctis rosea TaxID=64517 RepID=A0AAD5SJK3_9FUNG|nr:hypothetical protein HK097_003399 [Rhizophlyctis rosea]